MASMVFEIRILCLIALLPLRSFEFICPGVIYPSEGLSYAHIEPIIGGRVTQEFAKIRIKPIFHETIEGNPYKEMVQKAADFWSNIISVKPVSGRLFFTPPCISTEGKVYKALEGSKMKKWHCLGSCATAVSCDNFIIPKAHLDGCLSCKRKGEQCSKNDSAKGTGVENADLVFYVTLIDTKDCIKDQTIAYAVACQLDPSLDRPLFGTINICPKGAAKQDFENMLKTIKHEMLHAFGFAYFYHFRGSDGKPLWERHENGEPIMDNDFQDDRVLKTFEKDWHVRGQVIKTNRTFLVTPKVVKEARAHFGCKNLEGAELENSGRAGTRATHLEARVFYDDAMRGDMNGKGLFSRIDFAVLEDTGWYQVDYSQAEDMDFGRNLGCDFCMKSCKFWMDKEREEGRGPEPYCNTPDKRNGHGFFCIGTKRLFSGCPLNEYPLEFIRGMHDQNSLANPLANLFELPVIYQHFDEIPGVNKADVGKYAGVEEYTDLCPIPIQNFEVLDENRECYRKSGNDPSEKGANESEMDTNPTAPPNPASKQWEQTPTSAPNPAEEAKDDEDGTAESSQLGSSALFVVLFPLIVIMI